MKNLIRAFALSLVATGAVASAHMSNDPAKLVVTATRASLPVPSCPPDDPNACGIVVK